MACLPGINFYRDIWKFVWSCSQNFLFFRLYVFMFVLYRKSCEAPLHLYVKFAGPLVYSLATVPQMWELDTPKLNSFISSFFLNLFLISLCFLLRAFLHFPRFRLRSAASPPCEMRLRLVIFSYVIVNFTKAIEVLCNKANFSRDLKFLVLAVVFSNSWVAFVDFFSLKNEFNFSILIVLFCLSVGSFNKNTLLLYYDFSDFSNLNCNFCFHLLVSCMTFKIF